MLSSSLDHMDLEKRFFFQSNNACEIDITKSLVGYICALERNVPNCIQRPIVDLL